METQFPASAGSPASPAPVAGGTTAVPCQAAVVPTGARKALCIGIDAYPAPNRLGGCVADMNAWSARFQSLGFSVTTLSDEAATREAILGTLRDMIAGSSNR